jgi:general secretion pathway protein D
MPRIAPALVLIPALWFSGAAAAGSDPAPVSESRITSPGDTNLRHLVQQVGARLHKPFVVDPRAPQTLDLGSLKPEDLTYRQLLAVLQVNGLAIVEDEGLMQVLPDASARQVATRIVDPDELKAADDEWVTVIVPVKGTSAAQLVPILRPLMPQAAHLAAALDRNALIIVDRCANVRRIIGIIRTLERLPPRPADPAPRSP